MLKIKPELLIEYGPVVDWSGRKFERISPFQFVLWALDVRYMGFMMLNCLPNNQQGEFIRKSLVNQFNIVEENGVVFELGGKEYQEKHWSCIPLVKAMQIYIANYEKWVSNKDFNALETHWCKRVREQLSYLPAHIAQHFCEPILFFPMPDFKSKTFNRALTFYNYDNKKTMPWSSLFSPDAGLAVYKGPYKVTRGGRAKAYEPGQVAALPYLVQADLNAITALHKKRKEDLLLLKERLEKPIPITEQKEKPTCNFIFRP